MRRLPLANETACKAQPHVVRQWDEPAGSSDSEGWGGWAPRLWVAGPAIAATKVHIDQGDLGAQFTTRHGGFALAAVAAGELMLEAEAIESRLVALGQRVVSSPDAPRCIALHVRSCGLHGAAASVAQTAEGTFPTPLTRPDHSCSSLEAHLDAVDLMRRATGFTAVYAATDDAAVADRIVAAGAARGLSVTLLAMRRICRSCACGADACRRIGTLRCSRLPSCTLYICRWYVCGIFGTGPWSCGPRGLGDVVWRLGLYV